MIKLCEDRKGGGSARRALVLASASAGRAAILRGAGVEFRQRGRPMSMSGRWRPRLPPVAISMRKAGADAGRGQGAGG